MISNRNRKWWILAAICTGGGLIMLDETVVVVALVSTWGLPVLGAIAVLDG